MKVLFFVDTHGSEHDLQIVLEKSKTVDLVACLGDFTIFERNSRAILQKLNSIGKPVLLIHGNHETEHEIIQDIKDLKNIHFIHKKHFIFENCIFLGWGGGGFNSKDNNFTKFAENFMNENKKLLDTHKLILLTHAPPFGTKLDDLGRGYGHVGNESFLEFIIKYQPQLALSGHIHETSGKTDKVRNCELINPGPEGVIREL